MFKINVLIIVKKGIVKDKLNNKFKTVYLWKIMEGLPVWFLYVYNIFFIYRYFTFLSLKSA